MIRPLKKRLVIEPIDEELQNTIVKVVLFDQFNTKSSGVEAKSYTRGKVLALGADCDQRYGAKVGDVIRFTKHGGLPYEDDGKEVIIISENDIYGVEHGNGAGLD